MDATTRIRTRHAGAGLAFVCRCGAVFDRPSGLLEHHDEWHGDPSIEVIPEPAHKSVSPVEVADLIRLVRYGASIREAAAAVGVDRWVATRLVVKAGGAQRLRTGVPA